jgi:hypothetical protein
LKGLLAKTKIESRLHPREWSSPQGDNPKGFFQQRQFSIKLQKPEIYRTLTFKESPHSKTYTDSAALLAALLN